MNMNAQFATPPTLTDYADRIGCEVADMADLFAHLFFKKKLDTAAIAARCGTPESVVYNIVHAWREHGMEIDQ